MRADQRPNLSEGSPRQAGALHSFSDSRDSVAWFFCFSLGRKHCICRQGRESESRAYCPVIKELYSRQQLFKLIVRLLGTQDILQLGVLLFVSVPTQCPACPATVCLGCQPSCLWRLSLPLPPLSLQPTCASIFSPFTLQDLCIYTVPFHWITDQTSAFGHLSAVWSLRSPD